MVLVGRLRFCSNSSCKLSPTSVRNDQWINDEQERLLLEPDMFCSKVGQERGVAAVLRNHLKSNAGYIPHWSIKLSRRESGAVT